MANSINRIRPAVFSSDCRRYACRVCMRNSQRSGAVEMKGGNQRRRGIRSTGTCKNEGANFDHERRRIVPPLIVSHTHITSAKGHSCFPGEKSRRLCWLADETLLRSSSRPSLHLGASSAFKACASFRISYLAPVPGRAKRRVRRFVDGASLPSSDR
jgi:hypothetical protein